MKNPWFCSLDWLEFFHQDLHRQLFSLKKWVSFFLNQLLYDQSIVLTALLVLSELRLICC